MPVHCSNSTDCNFIEVCVDHWSGLCPGHCQWAPWFVSVLVWTCIGTFIGLILCLRADFCPANKIFCLESANNTLKNLKNRHDYSREVSMQQVPGQAPSFHEVVLVRSYSTYQKKN